MEGGEVREERAIGNEGSMEGGESERKKVECELGRERSQLGNLSPSGETNWDFFF